MVGSSFIYTECGKRKTLINTTQITAVYVEDIDLNANSVSAACKEYDPAQGTIYLLNILLTGKVGFDYHFTAAADRDAMYEKIMATLVPAVTIIDTSPSPQRRKNESPTR
jgi:hypothetical protein